MEQLKLFKENFGKSDNLPKPKTHSAHYLIHRYWGRKPVNVFSYLIKKYSKENDWVLDPFMGSGITVIESNLVSRNAVGIDLNPLSKLLCNVTLTKYNIDSLLKDFQLITKIPEDINQLFKTSHCNEVFSIKNNIWKNNELIKISFEINKKKQIKKPQSEDLKILDKSDDLLKEYTKKYKLKIPSEKILKFVKRSGITSINQLFTSRNLLYLLYLKKNISKIKNIKNKKFFLIILSAILPSVSNMIPGDELKCQGKSGWVISKYWVPSTHTEKNPIQQFKKKAISAIKALESLSDKLTNSQFKILNQSSEKINIIEDNSIDLILTDPPYGDSIAYLGLSMLWNEWLDLKVDYESEVIIDPYRKKDILDFHNRSLKVFNECYRVLKNNKLLIFTFYNRQLKIWKAIIDACLSAGFFLEKIEWMEQANSSGTQGINKKNTLKGDFLYYFKKKKKFSVIKEKVKSSEEKVIHLINNLFVRKEILTVSQIFEEIIPQIVNERLYFNKDGKIIDIDNILEKNFVPIEKTINKKTVYAWKKK